ncbi:hypothetical protein CDAR_235181 [Caerostris darwini]|uniref:LAGLIDADG homing endonuclease n=1 Tax=Caerostris darwini TaxID=1538125 RepID=A0AAV4MR62_9ARAC|nr:hypothetical protein CDAR_235181 [Caerostris darwini]
MDNYKLGILGMSEAKWTSFGSNKTVNDKTILLSECDEGHEGCVALILGKKAKDSLIGPGTKSPTIQKQNFNGKQETYLSFNISLPPMLTKVNFNLQPYKKERSVPTAFNYSKQLNNSNNFGVRHFPAQKLLVMDVLYKHGISTCY